jgi:hypothetical protein
MMALGVSESTARHLCAELGLMRGLIGACSEPFSVPTTRQAGALWAIFIADALAAPAHWYYDTQALMADYGKIEHYVAPRLRHSSNKIMHNHWRDNKHNVRGLVEGGFILHGKEPVWAEPFNHYHSGLNAGENTLNAQIARVVIRGMLANGGYVSDYFLEQYKAFMVTPGSHNDSYAEAFHRQFFDNHLIAGKPLHDSAGAENHDTPSIGGFVSVLPILLSAPVRGCAFALRDAVRHLKLTHRSDRLCANLEVYARALWTALDSRLSWPLNLRTAVAQAAREIGWDFSAVQMMRSRRS